MYKVMPVHMYQTFPIWMLECLASIGDKTAKEVLVERRFYK